VNQGIRYALLAALLFGASTPLAKHLLATVDPLLLAGLLYLGSGLGLGTLRFVRDRGWRGSGLARADRRWLAWAIVFGGMIGPASFMLGLARLDAASASLFLNFEAVLTAVLAWVVFRENAGQRIVIGMAAIVAGGVVLSWPAGDEGSAASVTGVAFVAAACLCWALDNNLTRKVSGADAMFIAGSKGLVAGGVLCVLALAAGADVPAARDIGAAMVVGLLGYGASLVCFVLALRSLGTARTGAYFSTAPFVGAAIALLMPPRMPDTALIVAAALMAIGVWLHLTERHLHEHAHDPDEHDHPHVHDEHHRHGHDFPWDGREPHRHPHRHEPLVHAHAHVPDLHHRHRH